jgi:hypothetical protein
MKTKQVITLIQILLSLALSLILNKHCGAQVSYTYDANGNRLASSIIVNHRPKKIRSNDTTKRDSAAEQTANRFGVSVYPNPTKNSVFVNTTNLNSTDAAIVY